jgi:hypothetical protein
MQIYYYQGKIFLPKGNLEVSSHANLISWLIHLLHEIEQKPKKSTGQVSKIFMRMKGTRKTPFAYISVLRPLSAITFSFLHF